MTYSGITVECEVDGYDIEAAGYHHMDDCEAVHAEAYALDVALDDLHRQAGHGDHSIRVCTDEPCRSLFLVHQGTAAA